MDAAEAEMNFLEAVKKSDFLYVYNAERYIGVSVGVELGSALAWRKPIFSLEPFTLQNFDYDMDWYKTFEAVSIVATPAEAARHMREGTFKRYGNARKMRAMGFEIDEVAVLRAALTVK